MTIDAINKRVTRNTVNIVVYRAECLYGNLNSAVFYKRHVISTAGILIRVTLSGENEVV